MSDLSFEQMLDESFKTLHTGEVVNGKVIDVKEDQIILNVGFKSDGIITRSEYSNDNGLDLRTVVNVGDDMEAKVLKINDGEIFGIIGHSGAGKSTILRCINRLESFDSGSIYVNGQDVANLDEKSLRNLRKDLGMIFQHFSLLERKTVFENVAYQWNVLSILRRK